MLPREIGVAVLTDRFSISVARPASKRVKYLSNEAMLSSMRRSEYTSVIRELRPAVSMEGIPNTEIYQAAKLEIECLPEARVHDAMVRQLRHRFESKKANVALSLPSALTAAGLGLDISELQLQRLMTCLGRRLSRLGE